MNKRNEEAMIADGIKFLRSISSQRRAGKFFGIRDVAVLSNHEEDYVRACIELAKANKEKRNQPPIELRRPYTVAMIEPHVRVLPNQYTGLSQRIQSVEIEVMREIEIRDEATSYTEFTTMVPVRVVVLRK